MKGAGFDLGANGAAGGSGLSPLDAFEVALLDANTGLGTGGAQMVRSVAEPAKRESNGRGMMIDDIALTETLPPNTVRRDGTLLLSSIGATLTDADGSETLRLSIGALPAGATLTDGTHVFLANQRQTTADVTGWDLSRLSLDLPANLIGTVILTVTATAIESSNGDTASTTGTLTIYVLPQAGDAPSMIATSGYASSACITVQAGAGTCGSGETAATLAGSGISIDWSGSLTTAPVRAEEWESKMLCLQAGSLGLAEQTGLVVRLEG